MVSVRDFQSFDVGSIPITRSRGETIYPLKVGTSSRVEHTSNWNY